MSKDRFIRINGNAFALACRQFGLDGKDAISQGVAYLMEMGTGKTITSVAIRRALSRIIFKRILKRLWKAEASGQSTGFCYVIAGSRPY